MKKSEKGLANKTEVSNKVSLGGKNGKKMKNFNRLFQPISFGKSRFEDKMMGRTIIYCFSQFINILKLQQLAAHLQCKSANVCQMKILNLLLDQIIFLIQSYIAMIVLKHM